jgi:hypothetical protein
MRSSKRKITRHRQRASSNQGRPTRLSKGVVSLVLLGIGSLLKVAIDMIRKGESTREYRGDMKGKASDGKRINVKYGYTVKTALDDVSLISKEN